jgi:hypothetical protein
MPRVEAPTCPLANQQFRRDWSELVEDGRRCCLVDLSLRLAEIMELLLQSNVLRLLAVRRLKRQIGEL